MKGTAIVLATIFVAIAFFCYEGKCEAIQSRIKFVKLFHNNRDESGKCGDDVTWVFNSESKTLTISGKGNMSKFEPTDTWDDIKSKIKSVVIEDGVTSIADYAFDGCSDVSSVSIPPTVSVIGSYAFARCIGLQSIIIPSSVTAIEKYAFYECATLSSIVIPASVTSVGPGAFQECLTLSSVTLSPSITRIEFNCFLLCSSLTSIVIPPSVTSIGMQAFYRSGLQSIFIPTGVTEIGREAFMSCDYLKNISIPATVTSIGEKAISCCTSLRMLYIPSSVTEIGKQAFYYCLSLQKVYYDGTTPPTSGKDVFESCDSLQSIFVPNDYAGDAFCGMAVYPNQTLSQSYLNRIDECTTVLVAGPTEQDIAVMPRSNATDWESKTTQCMSYTCVRGKGGESNNTCYGDHQMCVNQEKCMKDNKAVNDKVWKIEIEVRDMHLTEINLLNIRTAILDVSDVVEKDIDIGTVANEQGEVQFLVVYVNDEENAEAIHDGIEHAVSRCSRRRTKKDGNENDHCDVLMHFLQKSTLSKISESEPSEFPLGIVLGVVAAVVVLVLILAAFVVVKKMLKRKRKKEKKAMKEAQQCQSAAEMDYAATSAVYGV